MPSLRVVVTILHDKNHTFVITVLAAILSISSALRAVEASQPLKKDDRIVFALGDSITQAGVKSQGYVTVLSEAINTAYPELSSEADRACFPGLSE
jgi:hypothetical protein